MLNLENVPFRQKITALSVIPLLGILLLVALSIRNELKEIDASNQVIQLTEFSVHASALVHELQKERGMSSLFISSKGSQFSSELSNQRSLTDAQHQNLKSLFDNQHFSASSINAPLAEVKQQLEQINNVRSGISQLTLSPQEAIAYYTKLNAQFLDIIAQLPLLSTNVEMANKLSAYANFLKSKERAGIERAVLSSTFANDGFLPSMYEKLLSLLAEQNTYQALFISLAPADYKSYFRNKTASTVFTETLSMREKALSNGGKGPFGVDPKIWFNAQTTKINVLKEIEDFIAQNCTQSAQKIKSAANYELWLNIILGIVIFTLSIILSLLMSNCITAPVKALHSTISKIQSKRDLTLRLPIYGQDEIGQVAQAFNVLMADFENIIRLVNNCALDVLKHSETLAENSKQLSMETSHLSDSASSMAAAMEQMGASIENVADNARNVQNITENSNSLSEHGTDIINKVVNEMTAIADVVGQAASKMQELDTQSTAINSIIKVIRDIAGQTNLLALNASIEAARAGEQGRGFAVVADEVRSLSVRTTHSAQEIESMIIKMQNLTRDAVTSMNVGVAKVNHEVNTTQIAGDSIQKIHDGTQQVNVAVTDISGAIGEQSHASNEIGRQVERVAQMAEESYAASNSNAETANEMKTLSANLQNIVASFKISS